MLEIEQGAVKTAKTSSEYTPAPDLVMQTSIAISLKRIADALEKLSGAVIQDLSPGVPAADPFDSSQHQDAPHRPTLGAGIRMRGDDHGK